MRTQASIGGIVVKINSYVSRPKSKVLLLEMALMQLKCLLDVTPDCNHPVRQQCAICDAEFFLDQNKELIRKYVTP